MSAQAGCGSIRRRRSRRRLAALTAPSSTPIAASTITIGNHRLDGSTEADVAPAGVAASLFGGAGRNRSRRYFRVSASCQTVRAGSEVDSSRVPGPVPCPPPGDGISSQYWSIALDGAPAQPPAAANALALHISSARTAANPANPVMRAGAAITIAR